MLLILYLLSKMDYMAVSMFNTAKYAYCVRGIVHFIPSIEMRCILGETSDWWSLFGFYNEHRERIKLKMQNVHDLPAQYRHGPVHQQKNWTLGPLLLSLWHRAHKDAFHEQYLRFQKALHPLSELAKGRWWKKVCCTEGRQGPVSRQRQAVEVTLNVSMLPSVPKTTCQIQSKGFMIRRPLFLHRQIQNRSSDTCLSECAFSIGPWS